MKGLNSKRTDMVKWCNNLDGEMLKFLQWGFGEMSKCNGVIFLPNSCSEKLHLQSYLEML